MFNFLRADTQVSSTRVVMFLSMLFIGLIFLAMTFHIVWTVAFCTATNWSGMTMLLGGLSAFFGTVMYGKVAQKKEEVKEKIEISQNKQGNMLKS